MKVAVIAGLFAKWDVEVNASHGAKVFLLFLTFDRHCYSKRLDSNTFALNQLVS
jgi:hypothetical protein